ncbi:hypothetical protein AOC36_02645 [Erysipelothrix larvae]|uniref:Permease n=1 Tax=Erysipelothrix larvae TaxID=1514105 RepID=A0A0X8GYS8_9FIRM|nr:DUF969 domain-containing protein [Erysipelothrix larvae]AMC92921.1 hypothetical protein AOC36_02645 [Erysipelothrix larvae]
MEWIRLIGVVIIVVGFLMKLDTLAVVILAGLITGLVSGMGIIEILHVLGSAFITNRFASIFIISLPVIAILERYGLKVQASNLIAKIGHATAGKVLSLYMGIRTIASALSIRIGGHVQFIRPLILPMTEAAAKNDLGQDLDEAQTEKVKAYAASVENYGNFFGQNVFAGSTGVLLIVGTLSTQGYAITPAQVAIASIPIAICAVVVSVIQFMIADKKMKRGTKS